MNETAITERPTRAARPLLRGWLHLAALPPAILGGVLLISRVPEGPRELSVLAFAVGLVGLYTTSALYHVPTWSQRARRILARVDVAMIQLAIVATFTPIAYHALSGPLRTWSLTLAWTIGLIGAAVAASPLQAPRWVGATSYTAFAWLLVVPLVRALSVLPTMGVGLLVLGGLLYTVGAIVYTRRRPDPYPRWFGYHELFHLLVIAASVAHYLAIWRYVLPIG